jgi:hypothetical protein
MRNANHNIALSIEMEHRLSAVGGPDPDEVPLLMRHWVSHRHILNPSDVLRFERTLTAFAASWPPGSELKDMPPASWINAGADLHDCHERRAALTIAFLALDACGQHVLDPRSVSLPSRTTSRRRPLTAFELGACRTVVECSTGNRDMWGATLGVSEATAVSMERPNVRLGDVDPATRRIKLPGTPGRIETRVGKFTPWAQPYIVRRVAHLTGAGKPATAPLIYDGKGNPASSSAAATPAMLMTMIVRLAGIEADDVSPESIRNTTAKAAYNGSNIEYVQTLLGCRSLDQARREIGVDPHKPCRVRHRTP